jgi:hypothetical protein
VSALRLCRAYLLHPHAYLRRYSRAARMFARLPRLNGSHDGVIVTVRIRPGETYGMAAAAQVEARAPPTPPPRVCIVERVSAGIPKSPYSSLSSTHLRPASLSQQGARTRAVPIEQSRGVRSVHLVIAPCRALRDSCERSPVIRNPESRLDSTNDRPSSCSTIPGNST